MSEWWTYTLSDFLLFSPRTYFRLLELYNREIWPVQILALALGVATLLLLRRGGAWQGRCVTRILAGCWIWVAWAFHFQRYATINWAAPYFAAAFAVEALLLIWMGVVRGRRTIEPKTPLTHQVGFYVLLFALVAQPAIGPLVGRNWVQSAIFGVAPDPTVIATLGVLLLMNNSVSWGLLVIPLLWCAVSGAFQWTMASPDALVMPFMGLLVLLVEGARTATSRRTTR